MRTAATLAGRLPEPVRRAGPLALAGIATNAIAVVVTVALARLLPARDYGALAQLYGVFLVLSMPGSALLVAVVRRLTAWEVLGQAARADAWVRRVRRMGVAGMAGLAAVAIPLRWPAASLLGLPGPGGVSEVLLAGGAWALLSVARGGLQARRAYGTLARNMLVEAGGRTVLTVGLVAAGLGVAGAAAGLLGAVALAAAHATRAFHCLGPAGPVGGHAPEPLVAGPAVVTAERPLEPGGRRHLVADLAAALCALGLLAILQTMDVIVLGRERPSASGPYAAVSVAAKSLVFAAIILAAYLLPEAAAHWHRGERALRQLGVALVLVAVPAAVLVTIGAAAPELLLGIVFGPRLTGASAALVWLALAMACLAGTVLCTNYLLGVGRRRVVAVLAAGVAAGLAALSAADGRPVATARADLAVQAALFAAVGAMVVRVKAP